jgi:hypothetical protein
MNIKLNLKKCLSLKGVALVLVLTTATTSLTGCGKKADCNISDSHAHLYTNEQGYIRYIDKEYLSYEGYERNEEYITIEGEEDLYRFMDKKNLMRISDNLDVILNTQEQNVDYTEYRYRYTYMQPIPHTRKVGKTTTTYFTYIPVTRYSWTSNPNHSRLTGETRLCHYVYVAYKIEKNEKGKYVLIPSEQVDDIREVMDEYPYISKKYIKVVNINGEEVDYEDGKEEELTEEEQNRIEEYEESQPTAYYEEKGKTLTKTYT